MSVRKDSLKIRGILCGVLCAAQGILASETPAGYEIASGYFSEWEKAPSAFPSGTASDGVPFGNGDFKAIAGLIDGNLTLYLLKNDFWRLQHGHGKSQPRGAGVLTIKSKQLGKAPQFMARQSLADGTATIDLAGKDASLQVKTCLFASANILRVTISTTSGECDLRILLRAPEDSAADIQRGQTNGIQWVSRKFIRDVDVPTAVTVAMKVDGSPDSMERSLRPDQPVTIWISVSSAFQHADERAESLSLLASVSPRKLKAEHQTWWENYWDQSWVHISNPVLEKHYYQSLYGLGAASRNPEFPPGIFGWETQDHPRWQGDYHLNYNHFAPYYGLYSANRIEQADPQDAPVLDFMERARRYARISQDRAGTLFPVGIGPKGIDSTLLTGPNDQHYGNLRDSAPYEDGMRLLVFGQKSNGAYAAINLIQRWRTTQDPHYARDHAYPFVLGVVDFWEEHLMFEDNRYVIYNDSIHEGSGEDINPILSLGLVPNVFKAALEMSMALDVDADRREKWQHILDHMSGWAFQEREGKTVFRYTEKGTAWWGGNTLGIQHIYPANAITLESDPELLQVARNTITVRNGWRDGNGSNSFYPAAVRVGYNPKEILRNLEAYALHTRPNGMQAGNPHGIENFSTTPNTINMMLCMSADYIIRLFPVWPKDSDACFENIRCWGAFRVSGELKNGEILPVRIVSEQGLDCTIVNPWPNQTVYVHRKDGSQEALTGTPLKITTKPDEVLWLSPSTDGAVYR